MKIYSRSGFVGTAFSPDGHVLGAVGGGVLHLWQAPSWEEIVRAERAATEALNWAGSNRRAGP